MNIIPPCFRHALLLVLPATLTVVAKAATIANGSFETGFTSWITTDLASPHVSLAVRGNGYNSGFGFASTVATQGSYSASHGFDGGGPGTISMAQDIGTVDLSSAILSFDYRAGWNMLDYGGSTQARVFSVVLRPAGGGGVIAAFEILRANPATRVYDTGSLAGTVDLSAYVGTNARLSFESYIPQSFTGPAFMQLDNVKLTAAVPEPGSVLLCGIGLSSLLMRRRR